MSEAVVAEEDLPPELREWLQVQLPTCLDEVGVTLRSMRWGSELFKGPSNLKPQRPRNETSSGAIVAPWPRPRLIDDAGSDRI